MVCTSLVPSFPPSRALARYAVVALAVMAVGVVVELTLGVKGAGRTSPVLEAWPFLDMWVRWDAGWYEQIAAREYTFSATEQSAAAYFPVYPLLMRGFIALGLNVFLAGIVVTWLAGAAAAVTFSRWAVTLKPEAASLATWLLLAWPFSFFLFGAVYSDAVFLLLMTSAFLLMERGRWGWATVVGAVATATRPIAPAVVLGLVARHIERRRTAGEPWGVKDAVPLASGAGLAAFMGFLWWRFGDPLAFATTQVGWGQLSGPEAWLKYGALKKFAPLDLTFPAFHAALAFLCLWLAWRMRTTLGCGYALYVGAAVGIPLLSSRDFIGLGRYALAGFPVFLQLALELPAKPRRTAAWLVVSAVLLGWMTSRFAMGFYTS